MNRLMKILRIFLIISAIATIIQLAILYWYPYEPFALGSFSAIRLLFIAYAMDYYMLIPICYLAPLVMILTSVSIKKKKKIVPGICLAYYIYDLASVFGTFYAHINENNYFIPYQFIQSLLDLYCIIMIIIYFVKYSSNKLKNV